MNLKEYISEAVSSGKHRINKGTITDKTNINELCEILEACGIRWIPKMKYDQTIDTDFITDIMKTWKNNYDCLDTPGFMTRCVIVTDRACFILYWETDMKGRNGPTGGSYQRLKNGHFERVTGVLEEALIELNKELGI